MMRLSITLLGLLCLSACDLEAPKAMFYEGQVVQTTIGHIRGVITTVQCGNSAADGCRYAARFPIASMSEVEVRAYEIEPVPKVSASP